MIEFFFDISSPWTYLAFHNVGPLAAELGVPVRYRPILVGGIFNTVNPGIYAARDHPVPAKAAYMQKDLQDWARRAGIRIVFPPKVFPVNSVKVMRACLVLEPLGQLLPFARAAFEAYWGDDLDISSDSVLATACGRAGIDAGKVFEGIARQQIKDELKANTDEVIRRGGFGSPTIFVGDDMYFGNDRLVLVREAVIRAVAHDSGS